MKHQTATFLAQRCAGVMANTSSMTGFRPIRCRALEDRLRARLHDARPMLVAVFIGAASLDETGDQTAHAARSVATNVGT